MAKRTDEAVFFRSMGARRSEADVTALLGIYNNARRHSTVGRFGRSVLEVMRMRGGYKDRFEFLPTLTPVNDTSVSMENTYKMEPEVKINESEVRSVCVRILESLVTVETYSPIVARDLVTKISNLTKLRCKRLAPPRYKVVVVANVGQVCDDVTKCRSDVTVASRCVWQAETDCCVASTFENESIFAVVNCFFIYTE